ncbi:PIN domain-containing protein [Rhizobium mesosinicum]|uniref:PIN domain-containing protein n=1 Tax=Rhizobium mesosinicum TaxID=335017 RepID=A0ABS7H167_9HYPH|nr:PIN domain-containing protein [Rhizobium mesosinicum]MBW9056002.1 PIN domain-containing protein [Rhizobium mesosinicum]
MISTFTAFIDANVFYGARLRSLVLFVAQSKIFRARWSNEVHDEWVRNLIKNRPDLKESDLDRTRQLMNAAVPDCLVEGYEPLIAGLKLPDENDRHVLAAAILTRANVIVTFNEKDFPEEVVSKFRLHTKHPDDFLVEAYSLSPADFAEAVRNDFTHYGSPPLVYEEYLESLARAGVPQIAKILEPFKVLMPSDGNGGA